MLSLLACALRELARRKMDPENIIKGRIAESLVEELLKTGGNRVYRFGYEALLQNLTQIDSDFDRKSEIGQQVSSIPDFVVLNSESKPIFVEVKFRSNPERWLDMKLLQKIRRFWNAKVILVTITKPYFRVASPSDSEPKKCIFESLEKDHDLNITREKLQEFDRLVERFLLASAQSKMNGSTAEI